MAQLLSVLSFHPLSLLLLLPPFCAGNQAQGLMLAKRTLDYLGSTTGPAHFPGSLQTIIVAVGRGRPHPVIFTPRWFHLVLRVESGFSQPGHLALPSGPLPQSHPQHLHRNLAVGSFSQGVRTLHAVGFVELLSPTLPCPSVRGA